MHTLYTKITDRLTLKQYSRIMGGNMSYLSKIQRIRKVTKDRVTLILCDELERQLTGSN